MVVRTEQRLRHFLFIFQCGKRMAVASFRARHPLLCHRALSAHLIACPHPPLDQLLRSRARVASQPDGTP